MMRLVISQLSSSLRPRTAGRHPGRAAWASGLVRTNATMAGSGESKLLRLGFIGGGQMAEALAKEPVEVRQKVMNGLGIAVVNSNEELVASSDVIVVAVKPYDVFKVLSELEPMLGESKLIISIAAGVTLHQLQNAAGPKARLVRVMPNSPCLVGAAATAMSLGPNCGPGDARTATALFNAVGVVHAVEEKLLDAVTGLSGSGPAYIFMAIEAMADGGVAAGLPRDVALSLAAQTVLGAAKMVQETGKHPGALKDQVASPGGTTIAGIHELERTGMRASFMNAVMAASNRSREMSKL